jgi:hypothetical protein
MFSTIYPILNSSNAGDAAFLDVLSRIDTTKVIHRMTAAAKTGRAFKVVLFQYFYTRKNTPNVPNLLTRLPTGMILQDAFFKFNLLPRIEELFNPSKAYGSSITVYRRRRLNFRNGQSAHDPHVVQIVLSVAENVFCPIAPESSSEPVPASSSELLNTATFATYPDAWYGLPDGNIRATLHTNESSADKHHITFENLPTGYFVFAEVPPGKNAVDGNGTRQTKLSSFSIGDNQYSFAPAYYGFPTLDMNTKDVEHILVGTSCLFADSDTCIAYRVPVNRGLGDVKPTIDTSPTYGDVDVDVWSPEQAQDGRAYIYQSICSARKIARVKTTTPNDSTRNSVPLLSAENGETWSFENVGPEPLVLLQDEREVLIVLPGELGIVSYFNGRWD